MPKTTKPTTASTTRIKRANRTPSTQEKWEIISLFCSGSTDFTKLGHQFSTSNKEISRVITNHWDKLSNLREAKLLTESQTRTNPHKSAEYHALKAIARAQEDPNGKFLELLSEDNAPLLTDHEIVFATIYVTTGSYIQALNESKLDMGILKKGGEANESMALKMRCSYLRAKPNVAAYIMKLKSDRFIPEAIDKTFIQRELLEQLSAAKEDIKSQGPMGKKLQLRITEALGRSVGAFADVVKIEKVDPASALDYLESLAEADIRITSDVAEIAIEAGPSPQDIIAPPLQIPEILGTYCSPRLPEAKETQEDYNNRMIEGYEPRGCQHLIDE